MAEMTLTNAVREIAELNRLLAEHRKEAETKERHLTTLLREAQANLNITMANLDAHKIKLAERVIKVAGGYDPGGPAIATAAIILVRDLTPEEREAVIYYLVHLEAIQAARKAAA